MSVSGKLRIAVLTIGCVALAVACTAPATDQGGATASTAAFTPTATIQDIMLSMVDPSADSIWESVATIATLDGVEERRPHTDEDWANLHIDAVRLVEATNLLLMKRAVAASGTKSENPGIELEPAEIQVLIDKDPAQWHELVHGLYEAGKVMLDAVNERDADKLFNNGGPLDEACEHCHRQYWYPENARPAETSTVGTAKGPAGPASAPTTVAAIESTGTIEGHVHLDGKPPGNRIVRMGMDPKCTELYAGSPAVEEVVAANREGDLANVFVKLEGQFPPSPVPAEPVVIDQQKCFFVPRVTGARVGQPVEFRNSDPLAHNVHGMSASSNGFNFAQPKQGMTTKVSMAAEGDSGMLKVKCDMHRWMNAYVGVVDHPYFAVTDDKGSFMLQGVPVGPHTIQAWHERFGVLEETVTVEKDKTATVDFTYSGGAS